MDTKQLVECNKILHKQIEEKEKKNKEKNNTLLGLPEVTDQKSSQKSNNNLLRKLT